jgi:hypothetical protein
MKLRRREFLRRTALGVSCHSLDALQAAAREPWVESVHARINPYGMSMGGARQARRSAGGVKRNCREEHTP